MSDWFHWGEIHLDWLHCLNLYSGTQITSNPLPLYSAGKAACKPAGPGWAKANTELAFSSAACVQLLTEQSPARQWSHRSHYTELPDKSTLPFSLLPACFRSLQTVSETKPECFRERSSLKNPSKRQSFDSALLRAVQFSHSRQCILICSLCLPLWDTLEQTPGFTALACNTMTLMGCNTASTIPGTLNKRFHLLTRAAGTPQRPDHTQTMASLLFKETHFLKH